MRGDWGGDGGYFKMAMYPINKRSEFIQTVTINDPGHTHTYKYTNDVTTSGPAAIEDGVVTDASATGAINSNFTGLKGTGIGQNVFVANAAQGGSGAHSNVQVGLGCYYIMYIP